VCGESDVAQGEDRSGIARDDQLRRLPFFAQFFFIDALFVLFTQKQQRAFELITKTREVALMLGLVLLT
jgi:hypothetical protein